MALKPYEFRLIPTARDLLLVKNQDLVGIMPDYFQSLILSS